MTITHLCFDLHGVLIDPHRIHLCRSAALGRFMAERFGGVPEAWERANHQIEEDWDSYYADLDFGGDDCVQQMWEGEHRITRARFRLTGTPEPPPSTTARNPSTGQNERAWKRSSSAARNAAMIAAVTPIWSSPT